jgi:hypothetical protein
MTAAVLSASQQVLAANPPIAKPANKSPRLVTGAAAQPALTVTWNRSTARTFADLFGLGRPALHLPRYPSYRTDETLVGDFSYCYLRGERFLSCQAARFLLLGGGFLTLADLAAVDLTVDLSGYWNGYHRARFASRHGLVLRFQDHAGYRRLIAERPGLSVVSPHPFDSAHVPAGRFYLADPGLTVRLNDKARLPELTDRIPRNECLTPTAFAADAWRARWPLPFVVKLTEPSGGGDGVALCRREAELTIARARFAGRPVKIEQYFREIRNNYNLQLQIGPDGGIAYLGGSVQRVWSGQHIGNCIDLHWEPPAAVARVCDQAARAAAALGWHGVCGLDLIEDGAGEVWLIDPNFRLNGSTPFLLLRDLLTTRHHRPYLRTGYFHYPGSPTEMFDRFRQEIEAGDLIPVGAHYDPREDGITRLYAAAVSDGDPARNTHLLRAFATRGLRPGIGLPASGSGPDAGCSNSTAW